MVNDTNKDKTKIKAPSQLKQKIPKQFQASIVIVKGFAEGMEYPLTKAYTVLGRDKTANITLKDPHASREHAAILYQEGSYLLKDLDSTNGTLINGTLIKQSSLNHGDTFRIGDTTLQFILEAIHSGRTYEIG
jgi:pSer/pThr/pTyr-binding forkhead associated (FHA) protein